MTHEIKPCPFCGGQPVIKSPNKRPEVVCKKCDIRFKAEPCSLHGSYVDELLKESIEIWNTRANENETLHARIKELECGIENVLEYLEIRSEAETGHRLKQILTAKELNNDK